MALATTTELELILLGKKIVHIGYFNVNDNFVVFDPKGMAIVDGGITIQCEDVSLSIAWNEEKELFDVTTEPIETLLQNLDFYQIPREDIPMGSYLTGQEIEEMQVQYNWYQELDDDLELTGPKKYIIEELVIQFHSKDVLQIATIDYSIENKTLTNPTFNCQGALLVTLNNRIPIEGANNGENG